MIVATASFLSLFIVHMVTHSTSMVINLHFTSQLFQGHPFFLWSFLWMKLIALVIFWMLFLLLWNTSTCAYSLYVMDNLDLLCLMRNKWGTPCTRKVWIDDKHGPCNIWSCIQCHHLSHTFKMQVYVHPTYDEFQGNSKFKWIKIKIIPLCKKKKDFLKRNKHS